MSTVILNITDSWLDLTADQNFILDSKYSIQNLGSYNIFLSESLTMPSANEQGSLLEQHESALLIQESNNIYIRCSGADGRVAINTFG